MYADLSGEQRQRARAWLLAPRAGDDGPQATVWIIEPLLAVERDEELAGAFVDAVEKLDPEEQIRSLRWSLAVLPPRARARADKVFGRVADRKDVIMALASELRASGPSPSPALLEQLRKLSPG